MLLGPSVHAFHKWDCGTGVPAKWTILPLGTLAFHIPRPVLVLAALLPMQLCADAFVKAAESVPSI